MNYKYLRIIPVSIILLGLAACVFINHPKPLPTLPMCQIQGINDICAPDAFRRQFAQYKRLQLDLEVVQTTPEVKQLITLSEQMQAIARNLNTQIPANHTFDESKMSFTDHEPTQGTK